MSTSGSDDVDAGRQANLHPRQARWPHLRVLRAAALAVTAGAVGSLLAMDRVVAAMYDERGPALLHSLITRRDIRDVEHYQQLAADLFRIPAIALAALGVVATLALALVPPSTWRRVRARSGRLSSRTVTTGTLALAVMVGLMLRLRALLAQRSLWLDEVSLAVNIRDSTIAQLLSEPLVNTQSAPPGFLVAARAVAVNFGVGLIWIRAVPFVSGTLLVVLSVLVAQHAFRAAAARMFFVASVALSPILVFYSTEMKQYSTDALATMAVLYLVARGHTEGIRLRAALLGFLGTVSSLPGVLLFALLGMFTMGSVAVRHGRAGWWRFLREEYPVLLAWAGGAGLHVAYVVVAGADRQIMRRFWGDRGGFPTMSVDAGQGWMWYRERFDELLWITLRADSIIGPGTRSVASVVAGACLVLIASAAWAAFDMPAGRHRALLAFIGLTFTSALVLAHFEIYPLSSRLAIYLVPAVLLLLATGLDAAMTGRGSSARLAAGVLAGLVVLLSVTSASFVRAVSPYVGRDMQALLSIIVSEMQPGDVVITNGISERIVDWHRSDSGYDFDLSVWNPQGAGGADGVGVLGAEVPPRIWLVATHGHEDTRRLFELAVGSYAYSAELDSDSNYLALLSDVGPVGFDPTGDRRLVTVSIG